MHAICFFCAENKKITKDLIHEVQTDSPSIKDEEVFRKCRYRTFSLGEGWEHIHRMCRNYYVYCGVYRSHPLLCIESFLFKVYSQHC